MPQILGKNKGQTRKKCPNKVGLSDFGIIWNFQRLQPGLEYLIQSHVFCYNLELKSTVVHPRQNH